MEPNTALVERARLYAEWGLAPHWLRAPTTPEAAAGKAPIERDWQKLPRRTAEQIGTTYRPGYNLGLRTGKVEGTELAIVVVDLDSAAALEWARANLPATPIRTLTGRGEHWYYRHPGGAPIRNGVKLRGESIDVRGDGGQVVAPGSIHLMMRKPYGEAELWTAEKLQSLPAFDRELLATTRSTDARERRRPPAEALAAAAARVSAATAGERNATLNREAFKMGQLVAKGVLDAAAVRTALTDAARSVGLSDAEIDGVLRESETGALAAARRKTGRSHARKASAATRLISLAGEHRAELFMSDSEAFARIVVDSHTETWPIRSRDFESLLRRWYFHSEKTVPKQPDLTDAVATLEAQTTAAGERCPVFLRVGRKDDALYLDLGDPSWRAVEVTATGWRIMENPPVCFRRSRGMKPLPVPVPGGHLAELFDFVNTSAEDRPLVLGWLVAALRPDLPLPLLAIHGEQGCGKSSLTKALRSLIDPHAAEVRGMPREDRALMIGARHTWLLAFDNLSGLPDWLSDALCCLSTGGAYTARTLYTDDGETILRAQRPVILNGIGEVATRGDLLDRCILLALPALPEKLRRSEAALRRGFEAARPRLVGALLDAASCALRRLPEVRVENPPRMADFAEWVTAAEPALDLPAGLFLECYRENRAASSDLPLASAPITEPLRRFVEQQQQQRPALILDTRVWTGTAAELLAGVSAIATDEARRQREWPRNAQTFAALLRRLAPNLRAQGIALDFTRSPGGKRTRIITIAVGP